MHSELPVRGEEKLHIPGKFLLLILTVVCAALMILTFNTRIFSGVFNTVAGIIVTPFQRGVTTIAVWIGDQAQRLDNISRLQEEVSALQEQVDTLTTDNTALQQNQYELAQLRILYNLDAQYEDYVKTGARIIAKDAGNWFHSFIIDKGYNDGLAIDMNVLAGSGLVGRIVDIGPDWARVQSVIADNSSISGMVLSTADNLIVDGDLEMYNEGLIRFSKLTDNAGRVTIGEKIVTSNVSDKYLPGILIGYITTIENDANNLTKSGTLTPAVDFEHLETVLVIMEVKQTGDSN
ncbi:MAG: rod shape-determining protein MreC [Lachnospiraceae bacterium]|nr:rod shape-determining protein MreC [Lachnospiraceae bacterium]